MTSARLFHLATTQDWAQARQVGVYERSTRGRSLTEVGYIHCSYADQVGPVHAAIYADCADELVLLEIDPAAVGSEIKVERTGAATERYPHIYGPLPLGAVVKVSAYPPAQP